MGRNMAQLLFGFEDLTEEALVSSASFRWRAVARRRALRHLTHDRHVFCLDAGVGDHELEGEDGECRDEADDGKHVGNGFSGTFVVIVFGLEGGSLRQGWAGSAERLGRSLKLNRSFRKGDRRTGRWDGAGSGRSTG